MRIASHKYTCRSDGHLAGTGLIAGRQNDESDWTRTGVLLVCRWTPKAASIHLKAAMAAAPPDLDVLAMRSTHGATSHSETFVGFLWCFVNHFKNQAANSNFVRRAGALLVRA